MDDDAGLLRRARQGDEAAFSQLFARHQRAVHLFAAKMCGTDAGDDVVQETFLAVLRQTGAFDPARGTVAGYLLGIARHLVLKRLGERYRACVTENVDDTSEWVTTQDDVLEGLTRAETIDAVRSAVQSLPHRLEPPLDLFTVPPDYTIVEGGGRGERTGRAGGRGAPPVPGARGGRQ